MANVSLDKDLFYQYMINNNSTSTMLNALSGNTNTGVQSANDLSSVLGALQNSAYFWYRKYFGCEYAVARIGRYQHDKNRQFVF